jgi:protein involved in polysaccharide export with SLBB domain
MAAKIPGNGLDANGQEIILDADADTTLTVDTDDQIDIRIAGADDFQFTANTFTAQSGSTITTPTLGVGNTKDLGAGIHVKVADASVSAVK